MKEEPVKFFTQAVLNPVSGDIEFVVECPGYKITALLPPSQYLEFAKYHNKVAASYIEWMKRGGQ